MKSERQHLSVTEAHLHQRCWSSAICGIVCRYQHKTEEFIDTVVKLQGKTKSQEESGGKSEMVATDLQSHAGNAAWLHHLLSHTGLCNSLDMVLSHDPAPIRGTFSRLAGLIAGGRKIFDKIKFPGSGVTPLWKETVAPMKMVQRHIPSLRAESSHTYRLFHIWLLWSRFSDLQCTIINPVTGTSEDCLTGSWQKSP